MRKTLADMDFPFRIINLSRLKSQSSTVVVLLVSGLPFVIIFLIIFYNNLLYSCPIISCVLCYRAGLQQLPRERKNPKLALNYGNKLLENDVIAVAA